MSSPGFPQSRENSHAQMQIQEIEFSFSTYHQTGSDLEHRKLKN